MFYLNKQILIYIRVYVVSGKRVMYNTEYIFKVMTVHCKDISSKIRLSKHKVRRISIKLTYLRKINSNDACLLLAYISCTEFL